MTSLRARYSISPRAIAPALLLASFAAGGEANAACAPVSPVNDSTVTCTGTTTNQNGTTGYGTGTDTGNTYNILAGASVQGSGNALIFDRGTVNNAGSILAGGFFGVSENLAAVNNSGLISANSDGARPLCRRLLRWLQRDGVGTDAGGRQPHLAEILRSAASSNCRRSCILPTAAS